MATITQPSADRHWYLVGRWQEFVGESRANHLLWIRDARRFRETGPQDN